MARRQEQCCAAGHIANTQCRLRASWDLSQQFSVEASPHMQMIWLCKDHIIINFVRFISHPSLLYLSQCLTPQRHLPPSSWPLACATLLRWRMLLPPLRLLQVRCHVFSFAHLFTKLRSIAVFCVAARVLAAPRACYTHTAASARAVVSARDTSASARTVVFGKELLAASLMLVILSGFPLTSFWLSGLSVVPFLFYWLALSLVCFFPAPGLLLLHEIICSAPI